MPIIFKVGELVLSHDSKLGVVLRKHSTVDIGEFYTVLFHDGPKTVSSCEIFLVHLKE